MFARLLNALRLPVYADAERAYLEGAVSLADLERRQRAVDQGLFRRPQFDL